MNHLLLESLTWGFIAFGAVCLVWGIARMIKPTYYEEPTNEDTLWRGRRCANCAHGDAETGFPWMTCETHGKAVEAHHCCDDWA